MPSLISLTTDFGTTDPFVGIMKAVILGITPKARIVDLSHEIEAQNILQAARVLTASVQWFPKGSVHLAVVDPGVGSNRRALAVNSDGHFFVAPDNGILSTVLNEKSKIYALDKPKYFMKNVSGTFHGRDVFAPVSAWIAKGTPLSKLGTKIYDPILLDIPTIKTGKGQLTGEVIAIDRFGNLSTNILQNDIVRNFPPSSELIVRIGGKKIAGPFSCYNKARPNTGACLINSTSVLEIFCNRGNAEKKLKLKIGTTVTLTEKH
jgi:S-adenosyl-L-methionine hydrolase (adenosine-forming)